MRGALEVAPDIHAPFPTAEHASAGVRMQPFAERSGERKEKKGAGLRRDTDPGRGESNLAWQRRHVNYMAHGRREHGIYFCLVFIYCMSL